MLKKNITRILTFKLIQPLTVDAKVPNVYMGVESLEVSKKKLFNKTSHFYKQFCFFCLAVNGLNLYKYKNLKFKSLILSFWHAVAAFNVIS